MKIGDCINVWWSSHKDGRTYTWADQLPYSEREASDKAAAYVAMNYPWIRRLGVWKIKELKA